MLSIAACRVPRWANGCVAREQGLAALMGLHQGRGRSSAIRGKVKNEMLKGLARGRWKRLGDIARGLRERHGVAMGIGGGGYHVGNGGRHRAGDAPTLEHPGPRPLPDR